MDYKKTLELHALIVKTFGLNVPDHVPDCAAPLDNVDSLEMAEVIQVLEARCLASISFEKAMECETVQDLADLAEKAGWGETRDGSNEHMQPDE